MDEYIQKILVTGDASSAIKAFGDLQRAMHDYCASAAQVANTGDKIIDGNGSCDPFDSRTGDGRSCVRGFRRITFVRCGGVDRPWPARHLHSCL